MKITRKQLRTIIREALNEWDVTTWGGAQGTDGYGSRSGSAVWGSPGKAQYNRGTTEAEEPEEDEEVLHGSDDGDDSEDLDEKKKLEQEPMLGWVRENTAEASPFGSGMKRVKLDPEKKDVLGHT